jgi:hypothetical protein
VLLIPSCGTNPSLPLTSNARAGEHPIEADETLAADDEQPPEVCVTGRPLFLDAGG